MDTAMAASRLDWPIDRIRILVIDETGSSELQRRIESYASHRALHLSYHRKAKNARFPDAGSTRAALINFGLTETRTHGRLAGEFTLVLEADVSDSRLSQLILTPLPVSAEHGHPSRLAASHAREPSIGPRSI